MHSEQNGVKLWQAHTGLERSSSRCSYRAAEAAVLSLASRRQRQSVGAVVAEMLLSVGESEVTPSDLHPGAPRAQRCWLAFAAKPAGTFGAHMAGDTGACAEISFDAITDRR